MRLTPDDVFVDIGSGTGKVPWQVATQTPCKLAYGIEIVESRHRMGEAALDGVRRHALAVKRPRGDGGEAVDGSVWTALAAAADRTRLILGDFCDESLDFSSVTVVFINNTVFQPDLMHRIMRRLEQLPNLRLVRRVGCCLIVDHETWPLVVAQATARCPVSPRTPHTQCPC